MGPKTLLFGSLQWTLRELHEGRIVPVTHQLGDFHQDKLDCQGTAKANYVARREICHHTPHGLGKDDADWTSHRLEAALQEGHAELQNIHHFGAAANTARLLTSCPSFDRTVLASRFSFMLRLSVPPVITIPSKGTSFSIWHKVERLSWFGPVSKP